MITSRVALLFFRTPPPPICQLPGFFAGAQASLRPPSCKPTASCAAQLGGAPGDPAPAAAEAQDGNPRRPTCEDRGESTGGHGGHGWKAERWELGKSFNGFQLASIGLNSWDWLILNSCNLEISRIPVFFCWRMMPFTIRESQWTWLKWFMGKARVQLFCHKWG